MPRKAEPPPSAVLPDQGKSLGSRWRRAVASLVALTSAIGVVALVVKNVDTIWTTGSTWVRGKPPTTPPSATIINITQNYLNKEAAEIQAPKQETPAARPKPAVGQADEEQAAHLMAAALELASPIQIASNPDVPAWLKIAVKELGQAEIPGPAENARIKEYWSAAPIGSHPSEDLPWSAAFMNWVLKQAGIDGPKDGRAVNVSFLTWGKEQKPPRIGAIGVFTNRPGGDPKSGAHSCLFIGQTESYVLCLGGNVANAVRISAMPKDRLVGYRWPADK